jgi:recombination protein RecA
MEEIQEELLKKYKRNDLLTLASEPEKEVIRIYSTGSIQLDNALGVGGIPGGRLTELSGPPFGGKTTTALSTIARLHATTDEFAAYIDIENALDKPYAERCGVDLERLYIVRPEFGEQAFDIAEKLIRSGECSIVVVDSVPAIASRVEVDGEIGDSHVGLLPRLISQFLRKTAFAIRESGVAVIFINQVRDRIGRIPMPPDTPGGYALKHHASVRVSFRKSGEVKESDGTVIGSTTAFKTEKNKVAQPFQTGNMEIWGDRGICREAGLLDLALERGVIQLKGSWFKIGDEVIGQGRIDTINALGNPELYTRVEEVIRNG